MADDNSHDPHDLTGRTALITGASRGIGRAIAEELASHGCAVALAARSADTVQQAAEAIEQSGGRAVAIAADVTEDGAAERLVAETVSTLGGLDILINNAGGNSFSVPVASMRLSGWSKTMALNVDATVALIQQALPHLASSNHGVIINVGSVAGLRGAPMMSHYGAAKAAIASLTRSVALEAAHQGVRVNSLVPGWIETDLTDFLRVDEGTESSVLSRVPLGRWGRSDEIAQAALLLASDASSFMTGQELIVDGGLVRHALNTPGQSLSSRYGLRGPLSLAAAVMAAFPDGDDAGRCNRGGGWPERINFQPADKRVFVETRRLSDAIVVGAGTIRAERYRPMVAKPEWQDARSDAGLAPAVQVVIVGGRLDLPWDEQLFPDSTLR